MSGSEENNVSGTSGRIMRFEQRAYIRIETLRGKIGWEIHEASAEACGSDTIGFTTVKQWHKLFLEGCTHVVDEERSGRPSDMVNDSTNGVIVETMLNEDRRMTIREMEVESGICRTSLHRILINVLQKHKISAWWVPHFLSMEQKADRMRIAQDMLTRYRNESESFLKCIITIDKTWIRNFEPELKSKSNVWSGKGEKRPQKVRHQQSKVKHMMVLPYDRSSVIASYKFPQGTTMNADMYKDFL